MLFPRKLQWLKRPTAIFFALSLLIHGLILWENRPEPEPWDFSQLTPIELADIPTEKTAETEQAKSRKKPQVVETEKAKNDKLDPKAHLLSEKNQTVQDTRASQTDDFREKQGTGLKNTGSKKNVPPPTGAPENTAQKADDQGLDPAPVKKAAGVKRDWKTLSMKDLGISGDGGALAASDDHLNDVRTGDQTLLSTREFKFYSYYHRIKETLRQFWKPNVERKLAMMWSKGTAMKDAELVTQVLVLLDEKGTVAKISRLGSSGFVDLDEAAMDSFRQAAPFPNPPQGMVDPDGLVRIRWDFILRTEASPQISFRSGGQRRRAP